MGEAARWCLHAYSPIRSIPFRFLPDALFHMYPVQVVDDWGGVMRASWSRWRSKVTIDLEPFALHFPVLPLLFRLIVA
jgi:hypothetical protein